MKYRLSSLVCAAVLLLPLAGCESSEPANVMESAELSAVEEYEKMIADDMGVQDEESADTTPAE